MTKQSPSEKCLAILRKVIQVSAPKLAKKLTQDDWDDISLRFAEVRNLYQDDNKALPAFAKELTDAIQISAFKQLKNSEKRISVVSHINNAYSAGVSPVTIIRGLLEHQSTQYGGGAFLSIRQRSNASRVKWSNKLNVALRKNGLTKIFQDESIENQTKIAEAIQGLLNIEVAERSVLDGSGNAQAVHDAKTAFNALDKNYRDLADIMEGQIREPLRQEMNLHGVNIFQSADNIVTTKHISARVAKAGVDKWVSDIKQLLDLNKVREALIRAINDGKTALELDGSDIVRISSIDIDDMLRKTYFKISNNLRINDYMGEVPQSKRFFGSMAGRFEHSRILVFKDFASQAAYAKEYGYGSIAKNFFNEMERRSQALGTISVMGTSPEATLDAARKYLIEAINKNLYGDTKNAEKYAKQLSDIQKNDTHLSVLQRRVLGQAKYTDTWLSRSSALMIAYNSVRSLGKIAVTQFADMHTLYAVAKYNDIDNPFLNVTSTYAKQAWRNITKELIKTQDDANFYLSLGDAITAWTTNMAYLSEGFSGQHGIGARVSQMVWKYNLAQFLQTISQQTASVMLSKHLAKASGIAFDKLGVTAKFLENHGINEVDFGYIKQLVDRYRDTQYLNLERVKDLDITHLNAVDNAQNKLDSKVKNALIAKSELDLASKKEAYKNELYDKLGSAIVDYQGHAANLPSEWGKAVLFGDNDAGTILGTIIRLGAQFFQYPVNLVRNILGGLVFGRAYMGDSIADGLKQKGTLGLIVSISTASTLLAMLTQPLQNMVRGQTPVNPFESRETFLKQLALAQQYNPLLPFIGDIIASSVRGQTVSDAVKQRFSSSPTMSAAVDFLTVAENLFDLATDDDLTEKQKAHKKQRATEKAISLTALPQATFYIQLLTKYLFLDSLYSKIDPDWAEKNRKRLEKNNTSILYQPLDPFGE